jgi:hypothetical protein
VARTSDGAIAQVVVAVAVEENPEANRCKQHVHRADVVTND